MWHRRSWMLAPLLALLATAQATEPKWSGQEISDKFREVDRKLRTLRDLEKTDASAKRRLLDLEDDVRDLRTAVQRLETQMGTVRTTLDALRKDMARLVGTQPAGTAQETGKPGTATPVAPVGPAAEIERSRVFTEGDFVTITGTIVNRSRRDLTFIVVEATFTDARGNTVKTESAYTTPRVVGPKGKATFKIVTRRDPRIRNHSLAIRTK